MSVVQNFIGTPDSLPERSDISLSEQERLFSDLWSQYDKIRSEAILYCAARHGTQVDRGSGYCDFVANVFSCVAPVREQQLMRAEGIDKSRLFVFKKPEIIATAIECLRSLILYHELLMRNDLFAQNESIISDDSHDVRKGNIFRGLYTKVERERKKFPYLVATTPYLEVVELNVRLKIKQGLLDEDGQESISNISA